MSYKWPGIPNGDYSFDHGRAVWNKIINYLRRLSEKLDADIVDATADRRGMMTAADKAALDGIPDTYAVKTGELSGNALSRTSPAGHEALALHEGTGGYATDAEVCDFGWNHGNRDGAGVGFRSVSHATEPGYFSIYARDATQNSALVGTPAGDLTWNNDNVLTDSRLTAGTGITLTPIANTGEISVSVTPGTYAAASHTHPYLPLSGGTVTGTLYLSRTTDASGTADNRPAFIIGPVSGTHIEMDNNEIMVKYDETTPGALNLNVDGGNVYIGAPSSTIQLNGAVSALGNITLYDSALRASTTYNDGSGTSYTSTILQTGTANAQLGQHVALGGGSGTIVGAGESVTNQLNELIGSDSETLFLTADTNIRFRSNANTWSEYKEMIFYSSGNLHVPGSVYSNGVQLQNYTHPTTSGNRHIPSGGSSGQILRWSADGTAAWGADQDTVYTHPSYTGRTGKPTTNLTPDFGDTITISQIVSDSTGHVSNATDRTIKIPDSVMGGATASSFGTKGLVPRPSSGDQSKFLRGDATWQDALGYIASSLPSTFESSTGAYIKFENGLLFQWGTAATSSTAIAPDGSQTVTVTFPLPYVGAGYYTTVASPIQSIPVIINREGRGDGSYAVFRVTNKSSSNVTNRNFVWWALGRWK